MKFYQDITLLPQEDIDLYFLWQRIYHQIHLALVENKNTGNTSAVGVSFPEYDADRYCLGGKVRIFTKDEPSLSQINCEKWLNRFNDYMRLSRIKTVPEKNEGYARFKRIKLKGSMEKLARRRAKRKGETLQQALEYFADYTEQQSKLPYVNMISKTNGQHFRLFIEKQGLGQPQTGFFSCYGLSNTTTVPLF